MVVIDPGVFAAPEAVDGATAVLITHEHADHYDLENLRATDAPVFTIGAVARLIAEADGAVGERTTVVAPGETFDAGLPVRAVGEMHAVIHPDLPGFFNSGYAITVGEELVFYPGDSFTPFDGDVDVLLLPVCAPWAKLSEVVDYARLIGAPRNLAVHDMVYGDFGLSVVDRLVPALIGDGSSYRRLQPGQDL